MSILSKRRLGGGLLFAGGIWFGRETLAWLLGKALDLATQSGDSITLGSFPWQNSTATVCILLGSYLAFWPTKQKPKPSRADKMYALYERASSFIEKVRFNRRLSFFELRHADEPADLARDGISLLLTFKQAGLHTPEFQVKFAEQVCVGLESYFAELAPFMRDGHLAQIEAMVSAAAQRAESKATAFDPSNWLQESR